MTVQGKVFKYGDDVNTDVIFPGKYTYTVSDPQEMASHALEDLDPDFTKKLEKGDVVVAGKNFGCGSSREQAAFALKYAGVGAIVARSFARLYFRNAINAGLPAIVCPAAVEAIENGDRVAIDFAAGTIACGGETFTFPPLPPEVMQILSAGGIKNYMKKRFSNDG